jgi:hypothetical protein
VINWGLAADYMDLDAAEIAQRERERAESVASESVAPVAPRKADPVRPSPPHAENASLTISGDPVNALSLALDAAGNSHCGAPRSAARAGIPERVAMETNCY